MDKRALEPATTALIGVGLYTPAEAARLLRIPSGKITRWLRGHEVKGKWYERLWQPQVDLADGKVYLGFRDLMEMRTAHAFMQAGLSAITIRRAIDAARNLIDDERPLSTRKFFTDGRSIFLEVVDEIGDQNLLDIFRRQYAFKRIMEASLKDVEFDGVAPSRWWPMTKAQKILIDPERAFGQPIDAEFGVPTAVLAAAAKSEGNAENASRLWQVSVPAIKRAVKFENELLAAA